VRESGADRLEGRLLYILFATAWMQGDLALARPRGEMAVARLRELEDRTWLAWALCDLSTIMAFAGETEEAARLSAQGVALHRELGNAPGVAVKLTDDGTIAHQTGETATAAEAYAASLEIWRDLDDSWWSASPLIGVASLGCGLGRTEQAARLLGAANRLRSMTGAMPPPHEWSRDEAAEAAVKSGLRDDVFANEFAAGRHLTTQEAITEALQITEAVIAVRTDR
jgi:hypothetical protein